MSEARSDTASIAKMSAAMRPSFCAIASCLPIGWPHCTRSAAHRRAISRQRLAPRHRRRGQGEPAGVERDQRELESLALAPEHVLHRHLHVGEPDDAVLERLEAHEVEPLHHLDAGPVGLDDERGDLLRARCAPSPPSARRWCRWCTRASRRSGCSACRRRESAAVVVIAAGSEPTSVSVSANAEMAPLARRGRYFCFCSGVPNSLSGCGTPID